MMVLLKLKKVSEFFGYDVTKLKIIGHNISYAHNDNTHHELTFVIKDKKTNVVGKLVIDFVKKPNQKKFKGVVSLVTNQDSYSAATPKICLWCFATSPTQGAQASAVYDRNPETRDCYYLGFCNATMTISLRPATTA